MNQEIAACITKALHRAYLLGQTYWQQADSDSFVQHKRADETQRKFRELIDTTYDNICQLITTRVDNV